MAKIVGPSEFRRVLFRSELNGQDFCLGRWPTFDLESDATPPCPVTQKRKSIPSRKSWRIAAARRSPRDVRRAHTSTRTSAACPVVSLPQLELDLSACVLASSERGSSYRLSGRTCFSYSHSKVY